MYAISAGNKTYKTALKPRAVFLLKNVQIGSDPMNKTLNNRKTDPN